MPIYEYRCERCGRTFEVLVRAGQEEPTRCPHCGADSIRRVPSAFARGGCSAEGPT